MFDATAGVAVANASTSTSPKLSLPSAGETKTLAEAHPRVEQPVLERVGPDQPQPRAGAPTDLRPRAEEHRQPLALVVAADEDDAVLAAAGVGMLGDHDAVRDH